MLEMFGLGKQTINVKDVSYSNISGVTEVVLRADEFYSPFVEDELSKCSPTVLHAKKINLRVYKRPIPQPQGLSEFRTRKIDTPDCRRTGACGTA